MEKYKANDEVIVYWNKKEYPAKISKINNDNTTVKLLWPEKSKNNKVLVSLKFPIYKIKEIKKKKDHNPEPILDDVELVTQHAISSYLFHDEK